MTSLLPRRLLTRIRATLTRKRVFCLLALHIIIFGASNINLTTILKTNPYIAPLGPNHLHSPKAATESPLNPPELFRGSFRQADIKFRLQPHNECSPTKVDHGQKRQKSDIQAKDSTKKINLSIKRLIIIFVMSKSEDRSTREMIRKTWAKNPAKNIKIIFCLGLAQNIWNQIQVLRESYQHGDLLQMDHVEEKYKNLAWKTFGVLTWAAAKCQQDDMIMKTDSDVLIMFQGVQLLEEQTRHVNRNRIWGAFLCSDSCGPNRDPSSKWYVSKSEYPEDTYPDNVSGVGYILTGDCPAKLIAAARQYDRYFYLEDVMFTGIAAQIANISRVNHPGFRNYNQNDCSPHAITQHISTSPIGLEEAWRRRKVACRLNRFWTNTNNTRNMRFNTTLERGPGHHYYGRAVMIKAHV